MERIVKYLYYRGVRYAKNIFNENKARLQELSYRGATMLRDNTIKSIKSNQPHMYRGIAY